MNMKIEACLIGHSVSATSDIGSLHANIYPPDSSRKIWRICFANCSFGFSYLQGKVFDCNSLVEAKRQIERIAQGTVSGYLTTKKGMRGYFNVHLAPPNSDSYDLAPQSTSYANFSSAAKAHEHVLAWSTADGIPYQLA